MAQAIVQMSNPSNKSEEHAMTNSSPQSPPPTFDDDTEEGKTATEDAAANDPDIPDDSAEAELVADETGETPEVATV